MPALLAGAGRIAHRQLVLSFLCVDLAESSATLARLAEWHSRAIGAYHATVRTAVATHGGWEVARHGDRIVAAFLSPTEAVECALDIRTACLRHNRGRPDRLDIRIGIQLGEVDGALVPPQAAGLPPAAAEAGRLADAAAGDQILVSELVPGLARSRDAAFERTGLLARAGTAEPMPTFEIRLNDQRAAIARMPAELLERGRQTPFIGRVTERERLDAEWSTAATGDRRLAVLTGEPGVGKSRLAREFARSILADGGLILWGRSFEENVLRFQPFVEAVRQYFTDADPRAVAWLPEAVRSELARLAPEARGRGATGVDASVGGDDLHRLFEAVDAFLSGASIRSPILLVLDDLQWADPASLTLLKSLVLDPRPASLLVLGIYRDTDVPPSHPLARVLADIERERTIGHIAIGGLDAGEIDEMAAALTHTPISAELASRIREETAGNPYFAEELIRHLEALGMLGARSGAMAARSMIATLGVPRPVQSRLGRRLQRLSEQTREALTTAAIIGLRFRLDVLAPVLATDRSHLVALMDEAVRADLIMEVTGQAGRYGFRHPIVRRTLLEHLTANRRLLIRAQVARALAQLRREHTSAASRTVRHRSGRGQPGSTGGRRSTTPPVAVLVGNAPDIDHTASAAGPSAS